jgi:hypothetical protein
MRLGVLPARFSVAVTGASFALTGNAATFTIIEAPTVGVFTVTGNAELIREAENVTPGSFIVTGNDATVSTFVLPVPTVGGVGHYLLEMAEARRLAYVNRQPPPAIDRRTAPTFGLIGRPQSAPPTPAPVLPAGPDPRVLAQAHAAQAAKKQRDLEAILLLVA